MANEQMAFRSKISSNKAELDSSYEMEMAKEEKDDFMGSSSPEICNIQPRKLRFVDDDVDHTEMNSPKHSNKHVKILAESPPYRKVRALRLFDTPATPKTILQESSGKALNHLSRAAAADITRRGSIFKVNDPSLSAPLIHNRALDNIIQKPTANVNPFTPDSLMAHNKKRNRTQNRRENFNKSLHSFLNSEDDNIEFDNDAAFHQAPKRLALHDTNISRYQKEFLEISLIGIGEFGLVYQCLNRLDGCVYAIKKSIKPVAGSHFEKRALNEVWAHAVLGKHDNVVRYYSAWAEDDHMLIQNEYCNGGSLQSLIQKRVLIESELKIVLLHVAEGLRYIHSNDLVHMDLKSGNIFFTMEPSPNKTSLVALSKDCYDDGMEGIYEELSKTECIITYKIGDLGHVTSVKEPQVEEGDSRYLPNEILQEDYNNLFKADIFSLGITLYEAAGGGPLPKNGPEWHKLRNGDVPNIPNLSKEFNDLIKLMTHPDPEKRPSSTSIFNHPILNTMESKSKLQLSQELAIEKRKNELLLRKLREAKKLLKLHEQAAKADRNANLGSPQIMSDQRCLRSYTKRYNTSYLGAQQDALRDRNKNVIKNIQY